MLKFSDWFIARLSEPSTWAGAAGLVLSMKAFWPEAPTVANSLPMIGAALPSIIAIIKAESGQK